MSVVADVCVWGGGGGMCQLVCVADLRYASAIDVFTLLCVHPLLVVALVFLFLCSDQSVLSASPTSFM